MNSHTLTLASVKVEGPTPNKDVKFSFEYQASVQKLTVRLVPKVQRITCLIKRP